MFIFHRQTKAVLHRALSAPLVEEMWNGFCCTCGNLEIETTDALCFKIGTPTELEPIDHRYAISVSKTGVLVRANDPANLMQGILELMRRIKPLKLEGEAEFGIPCGSTYDVEDVAVRMTHLCVFPETHFDFLHKTIRLCAALHYTHIIIEPWGTFPFTCMPELAWPNCPTREQYAALIAEIRQLGMEPIPMLNHLGHAAFCRAMTGKHVVLDQNPAKALYFAEDGWTWAIDEPFVRELLRQIRAELYEVFGPGEYIHLGCDEAHLYGNHPELADNLRNYLVDLTLEVLEKEHRRPIIWGDMLLNHSLAGTTPAEYTCLCQDPAIAERVLAALDRRIVIADWHYRCYTAPFITSTYFTSLGFDVLTCPWEKVDNVLAAVDSVRQAKTFGVMETTWHTLNSQLGWPLLYACAERCRPEHAEGKMSMTFLRPSAATLARKVNNSKFTGYADCGWISEQIKI